jgi:hypothetical protein
MSFKESRQTRLQSLQQGLLELAELAKIATATLKNEDLASVLRMNRIAVNTFLFQIKELRVYFTHVHTFQIMLMLFLDSS